MIAAFADEGSAGAALDQLEAARADGLIESENAAVLHKDENGKLHIKETADTGPKGAAIGGVAGAGDEVDDGVIVADEAGVTAAQFIAAEDGEDYSGEAEA